MPTLDADEQKTTAARMFTAFCELEYPILAGMLSILLRDRWEAEDLAQEALVRAWMRWARVSQLDRPDLWVRRVAVNLAMSHWRRRAVLRKTQAALATDTSPRPSDERDEALLSAVRALPPRQRAALALRFYADLPVHEVAMAMGCRDGTVKALTSQGISRLRLQLGAS